MLLAQIPYLVSDPNISVKTLAEFYSFMTEKWFEREEGWVTTEVLKKFSEKLAVDIYLKRDVRSMERIPNKELRELIYTNMPNIDQWKLTTRSLINRDAEGNHKFSHRSFMEYFFILAYLNGEKSCLKVKWTDMMITLFESSIKAHLPVAKTFSIDVDDFSMTGVFSNKPWLWREPETISTKDCIESISKVLETRRNLETHISISNNKLLIWPLKEVTVDGQLIFVDLGVDLIWFAYKDASSNNQDLLTLSEDPVWKKNHLKALNTKKFAGAMDWRFPTIDEFEWIAIANKFKDSESGSGFLYDQTLYLCSDISQNQKEIIVSFGANRIQNLKNGVTYLGSRFWEKSEINILNFVIHVYETENQEQHSNLKLHDHRLVIAVSHLGAQNLLEI